MTNHVTKEYHSKFAVRGDLRIIRRSAKDGHILGVWEKKNVITYNGTDALVSLMAPNAGIVQEELQIKSMRFGESNLTPQRTDLDLAQEAIVGGSPVRIELLDAQRIIGTSTVEFVATLDSATGNGVTYREAGLFTRGTHDDPLSTGTTDYLFARQVFPDQVKTASVVLEFRWRVTFTV